ncbi:MAG TPA: hypothetical protein VIU12_15550 [Chryseolinea sp.]
MKKFLLFVTITIAISACAPVYVPNMRNSPLFRKAGEFQASGQFGNGLDAQAAVAVTNHIGVIGNFSYADHTSYSTTTNNTNNNDDYHKHKLLEGGLGYYQNDGNWCFEVFAGYGRGEGSSYADYEFWGTTTARSTGKYERYFIQPGFGFNKKVFHFSIIPRISVVNFTEFSSDAIATPIQLGNDPKVFFEPAFMGRVNLMDNHMFFCFQAGFAVPAATSVYFEYRWFQLSTGIGFRIGGWKPDATTGTSK